jgi:hypothetical protein
MQGLKVPERLQIQPEIWRRLLDQFGADLRVAAPGIIQSFDSDRQTVVVQLCIKERINLNGVLSWETIRPLVDVPVFMPRAGGYCLTMPVKAGDECLVIFGDNCIDAWWQSGGVQNQMDKRRHDLSDGFALVGIWSQPIKLVDYSTDSVQIRSDDGATLLELKGGKVTITATEIDLGSSSGIRKIIDERLLSLFNAHTHVITGVQTGGSTLTSAVPTTPLVVADCATTNTKAI